MIFNYIKQLYQIIRDYVYIGFWSYIFPFYAKYFPIADKYTKSDNKLLYKIHDVKTINNKYHHMGHIYHTIDSVISSNISIQELIGQTELYDPNDDIVGLIIYMKNNQKYILLDINPQMLNLAIDLDAHIILDQNIGFIKNVLKRSTTQSDFKILLEYHIKNHLKKSEYNIIIDDISDVDFIIDDIDSHCLSRMNKDFKLSKAE